MLYELTAFRFLVGTIVDAVITESLRKAKCEGIRSRDLKSAGRALLKAWIPRSKEIAADMRAGRRYKDAGKREVIRPLHSDYYGYGVPTHEWEAAEARIIDCLDNLESSPLWQVVLKTCVKDWGLPPTNSQPKPFFELDGVFVYAIFDLCLRDREALTILDWKTGLYTPESLEQAYRQLAVYALYAEYKLGYSRNSVRVQPVWLRYEGERFLPVVPDPLRLEGSISQIKQEVADELNLVAERQFPSGRREWSADRENFPPNPDVTRCFNCKYREICGETV